MKQYKPFPLQLLWSLPRPKPALASVFYTLLLLLGLSAAFVAHATEGKNGAKHILVLGDSISAAYGIPPEKGWVSLLNQRLNKHLDQDYFAINASVSGNTSGDGLGRLPPLLKKYQPEIVIVELGGNDGLRGYPLNLMQKNLQRIINLSQANGANVLLAGIEIPPNYGQRYTDAFRDVYVQLNKQNTLSFLPFILKDIATKPELMQKDQIHPTAEAQVIILENVWAYLEKLF